MTDRSKLEQMLQHLINEEKDKAEEIFHELVVAKSREIYENLLDDDIQVEDQDDEEEVDEASEKDEDEDDLDEMFGMDEIGGDPTDNMMSDLQGSDQNELDMDVEMGDEMGGDEPATKDDVLDIKDALEDLKAEFEAMLANSSDDSDDSDDDMEFDDEDDEDDEDEDDEDKQRPQEDFVREYVDKVSPAKAGDNGVSTRSVVAGKNDMGGTSANIAKNFSTEKGGTQGGLANPATKDMTSGNVNVPGSKSANKLNPAPGHGAEKKGSGDNGVNKKSIIGGKN